MSRYASLISARFRPLLEREVLERDPASTREGILKSVRWNSPVEQTSGAYASDVFVGALAPETLESVRPVRGSACPDSEVGVPRRRRRVRVRNPGKTLSCVRVGESARGTQRVRDPSIRAGTAPTRHTGCAGAAPTIWQIPPNCWPFGRILHTGVWNIRAVHRQSATENSAGPSDDGIWANHHCRCGTRSRQLVQTECRSADADIHSWWPPRDGSGFCDLARVV